MSHRSGTNNGRNIDLYLPHLKPKGCDLKNERERSAQIMSARAASIGSSEGDSVGFASPVKSG